MLSRPRSEPVRDASRSRPRPGRTLAVVLAVAMLTACTGAPLPGPGPSDDPQRAATELAQGLSARDVSAVEFVGALGTEVDEQYAELIRGIPTIKPAVSVAGVAEQGDGATATLQVSWTFPGVPTPWSYQTSAALQRESGRWKTQWQPAVVAPQLDGTNRLSSRRLAPERGELLGEDGVGIMVKRPVVRIGLDKSQVSGEAAISSARRLARLVDIDTDGYEELVKAAGTKAFVEAITFRANDGDRPDDEQVYDIPGALPIRAEQVLAPTREFARPIVGTVGEASKEIVDASKGSVVAGDVVGLSGLQRRYDTQLRGSPGVQVRLLPNSIASASPAPSASPSPTTSASSDEPTVVTQIDPVAGKDLTTTLNLTLQELGEDVLADTDSASALVAVRPSTGAIVAAAVNEAADGQALATVGQAAPGSTFKVVSSLALLRSGLKPTSAVECPRTITVDGRTYENYDDYPASELGRIDLQTALAQSCNTAFVGERDRLKGDDLASAAGSLGLGIDYDAGYPSYFGAVPTLNGGTGAAEAMFGQGKDLASPMAMAAVASSVSAGKTVIPYLVAGQQPTSTGQPLTGAEATTLRSMMRRVVTQGSGRFLADVPGDAVIAKTGTAEYGSDNPPKTHAWMIAAQGDLAVAVFVTDGPSGSRTAGPLLEAFLRGAR